MGSYWWRRKLHVHLQWRSDHRNNGWGFGPGTYTVIVTDGEGCTEKTVEVEAAVPISVATEVIDASCFGDNDGVATVDAEGDPDDMHTVTTASSCPKQSV